MTTFLLDIFNNLKKLTELLKLSLTSSEFYKKLYLHFKGLGLKYVFVLTSIGTLIALVILLMKLSIIINYFENRIITTPTTAMIDSMLNQWQTLDYDGQFISSGEEEPIMLQASGNKTLIALDPGDQLTGSIKKTIPIIFGKSKLILNIPQSKGETYQFSNEYSKIFGTNRKTIDSDELIKTINLSLKYFDKLFIFIGLPLMVALNFITIIFEKSLMIVIVYFALKVFVNQASTIRSAIRMVTFSCGLAALLLPIALISSTAGMVANLSQLWTSFLIIHAITTMRGNKNLI